MRSETTTQFYAKFEELSEGDQQKVLEKNYDFNVDFEWWDMFDLLLEVEQKKWIDLGLKNDTLFTYKKFYFSIEQEWYIQFVDLNVTDDKVFFLALGIPEKYHDYVSYNFYESRYSRNGNTKLELELDGLYYNTQSFWENRFYALFEEKYLTPAKDIFDGWIQDALVSLQKEYDYLTSEEVIKESLIANECEYEVDKDGNLV